MVKIHSVEYFSEPNNIEIYDMRCANTTLLYMFAVWCDSYIHHFKICIILKNMCWKAASLECQAKGLATTQIACGHSAELKNISFLYNLWLYKMATRVGWVPFKGDKSYSFIMLF